MLHCRRFQPVIDRLLCGEPFDKVGTGHRPKPAFGEWLAIAAVHQVIFYEAVTQYSAQLKS
jgi:hypothetical protein